MFSYIFKVNQQIHESGQHHTGHIGCHDSSLRPPQLVHDNSNGGLEEEVEKKMSKHLENTEFMFNPIK